mmetsp:Transcript_13733/g.58719  ORF Transcript_13733/g.58719 Transcript_13733/m.58719 type:complete len:211 (-) Transcript_13733:934-1566(-)
MPVVSNAPELSAELSRFDPNDANGGGDFETRGGAKETTRSFLSRRSSAAAAASSNAADNDRVSPPAFGVKTGVDDREGTPVDDESSAASAVSSPSRRSTRRSVSTPRSRARSSSAATTEPVSRSPSSPTCWLTAPCRTTPFASSHATQCHSGMSATCASTSHTCGDLTKATMSAGRRSALLKGKPVLLYPLGKSCRLGKPLTSNAAATSR